MDRPQFLTIRPVAGPPISFQTRYDTASHRITLADKGYLDYALPDDASMTLEGTVQNEPVSLKPRRVDLSKLLLTNRGFHWINERPFNR